MEDSDLALLREHLLARAEGDLIAWPVQFDMMKRFNLSGREAETVILQNGLLPARYQRNRTMINIAQQQQLLDASVAVIGCGGLGGHIIEQLARLGVGRILVVDPDNFEEHNLNRQLLSTFDNLGRPKVEAAVVRIGAINPVVEAQPHQLALDRANGTALLDGVDVAVDAMDNIAGRLDLAAVATERDIPVVHGAIAGWYGQVATVYPGEGTLQKLYANWTDGKGIEARLGNPSFTPAVVASLQVAEVCKLLLAQGRPLRTEMLSLNLLDMQFAEIPL